MNRPNHSTGLGPEDADAFDSPRKAHTPKADPAAEQSETPARPKKMNIETALEPEIDAATGPKIGEIPPGKRVSRLDAEIERLRKGTQSNSTRAHRHDDGREAQRDNSFLDGVAFMGIFSRTRDIIAANFTDMLDKADDPSKMIRMIILEMEETLVEVRASAARTIADQKEMQRHVIKLETLEADWAEKAQLALSKDREDLARAALVEKKKAGDMGDQLRQEIAVLDDALRAYEEDIQKLQHRLREARSRQTQIAARLESAENRVKLRTLMSTERTDEALARFDQLERRVDFAEGRAEAIGIADQSGTPSLSDEIAALEGADAIDDELEQMKKALGKDSAKKGN